MTELLIEAIEKTKQLKHLEHAEDRLIDHRSEGFHHAVNALRAVHNHLDKKAKAHITTKLDGCVHADTVLILANGKTRTIAEIIAAWSFAEPLSVIGYDEENNTICEATITAILKSSSSKNWLQLDLEDGQKILLTEDHQLLTKNRGWVSAGELTTEDDLQDLQLDK